MNKTKIQTLIITGYGLNCERETAHAFQLAGGNPVTVHLKDILEDNVQLDDFHILAIIGGFSFGDHIGAGTVFANRLKYGLDEKLHRFVAAGKLVIGICNGFQTITRLGLVPALGGNYFKQEVALAQNSQGVFRDDWVMLTANPDSPCVFTRDIDMMPLPIRHGEGRFAVASKEVLKQLIDQNLVALRYADPVTAEPTMEFPHNPNGSEDAIAGICDPSGRIFGLMPHPEAYLSPYNHPQWTRQKIEHCLPAEGLGLQIFRNAVNFAAANLC